MTCAVDIGQDVPLLGRRIRIDVEAQREWARDTGVNVSVATVPDPLTADPDRSVLANRHVPPAHFAFQGSSGGIVPGIAASPSPSKKLLPNAPVALTFVLSYSTLNW